MYIWALQTVVLFIPKTGSTAVKDAIEKRWGKCPLPGHLTAKEQREHCAREGWPIAKVIGLVREPYSRFISALNYTFGDGTMDLDTALARIAPHHVAFRPQSQFVDPKCKLWRFEQLGAMLRALDCDEPERMNASVKRWTLDDVREHEDWPRFRELIERDAELWERVK